VSQDTTAWRRLRLDAVDLSFEVHSRWPVRTSGSAERGGVFQSVADTEGVLFVRYGPDETIDAFIARLSDYVTRAIVTGDEQVTFKGLPARRLLARTDREPVRVYRQGPAGPIDSESSRLVSVVKALGFVHRGTPVLVGYRLTEESVPEFGALAEHMVGSVEWTR
jgi:hypothetical protein